MRGEARSIRTLTIPVADAAEELKMSPWACGPGITSCDVTKRAFLLKKLTCIRTKMHAMHAVVENVGAMKR